MLFKKSKRSPEVYLAETHQYVEDLKEINTLRSYAKPGSQERERYSRMIECMQEVLLFMNTLTDGERERLQKAYPLLMINTDKDKLATPLPRP